MRLARLVELASTWGVAEDKQVELEGRVSLVALRDDSGNFLERGQGGMKQSRR